MRGQMSLHPRKKAAMYLLRIEAKDTNTLIDCLEDIVAKHTPREFMYWDGEPPSGKWFMIEYTNPPNDALKLVDFPL